MWEVRGRGQVLNWSKSPIHTVQGQLQLFHCSLFQINTCLCQPAGKLCKKWARNVELLWWTSVCGPVQSKLNSFLLTGIKQKQTLFDKGNEFWALNIASFLGGIFIISVRAIFCCLTERRKLNASFLWCWWMVWLMIEGWRDWGRMLSKATGTSWLG